MGVSAATLALLAVYHWFMLPTGSIGDRPESIKAAFGTFWEAVIDFFKKDSIWGMLLFVFLYRSSEGLLLIEGPVVPQVSPESGGVGLSLKDKGMIDGTIADRGQPRGGFAGRRLPGQVRAQPPHHDLHGPVPEHPARLLRGAVAVGGPGHQLSFTTIATLVTIEKFGYSFGFVANMLYMMQQISPGVST